MILATVGTQLPFPRLIKALDDLAPGLSEPVIAQTGQFAGAIQNMEHYGDIAPREFDVLFAQARLVVAHAGIGTVLTAKKHGKPIILFPRRAAMGEHRNDHQLATATQLSRRPGIYVAWTEAELEALLMRGDLLPPDRDAVAPERERLNDALRVFLRGGER